MLGSSSRFGTSELSGKLGGPHPSESGGCLGQARGRSTGGGFFPPLASSLLPSLGSFLLRDTTQLFLSEQPGLLSFPSVNLLPAQMAGTAPEQESNKKPPAVHLNAPSSQTRHTLPESDTAS